MYSMNENAYRCSGDQWACSGVSDPDHDKEIFE